MSDGRGARDASGAWVRLPVAPRRIVSLVPSVTETLFALGLGERVVGVTDWCVHPADRLVSLPRVGGTKNPDVAAIASLDPDLVLANLEENREIDVRRLRERDLCVWVDFPCSVAETLENVRWLAQLGAPRPDAEALLADLAEAGEVARRRRRTPQRCFLAVWKDPWMTISSDTYAHDLLDRLGLENVFADATERYPRVALPEIAARDPEVILLPDEPYAFSAADADALRRELGETSAARADAIHVVDGTLTFWPGPRTARALRDGLFGVCTRVPAAYASRRKGERPMSRKAGDRYVCEKCGAQLVYEKACPCDEGMPHSEICCGEQMKKQG